MSDILNIFGLAFLGSIVALIGGVIFLIKKSWSTWLSAYSVPFAAGVLLTTSLVGLIPGSFEIIGEKTFLIVLISFLGAYFFEKVFFDIHHHEEDNHAHENIHTNHNRYKSSIPTIIAGDTIHNFIDGIVIAAAYFVSPGLGIITTLSTFLHEVPHEIGDFGIMLKAGWKRKNILIVNILSASATLFGAGFVIFFNQNQNLIGIFLAVSAGLFLYLGASDFLPHIHKEDLSQAKASTSLILGVMIMLLAIVSIPHSHDDSDDAHQETDLDHAVLY